MELKGFHRKLTAILSADVAGYSRLMQDDEAATVLTLESYKQAFFDLIKQHRGRVVDSPGDNLLAEFASVVDAVQCAVAVQKELQARNTELPQDRKMQFRIGVNLGDVIEEGERIYGDGVNIAARLESLADPGGICISKTAFDQIETKLPFGYVFLGEQTVKNIAKPVGAYRVVLESRITGRKSARHTAHGPRRRILAFGLAGVLVIIAGAALWQFFLRPSPPPVEKADPKKMALPLPEKPSIAVMPFQNMTGDQNQEFFCVGMSESVITALSKVPQLFVIARDSILSFKGKTVKAAQVSEELGVQYVLEGSILRAGDRLRVTAQLIDAVKGHHLWAERYEREPKDLFGILDDITKNIVTALHINLTWGESARMLSKGTENIEAYLKIFESMWYTGQTTRDGLNRARQLAEEAIILDPKFPTAYYVVGMVHMLEALTGFSNNPAESNDLCRKMLYKAIDLDESFAPARAALSYNLTMLKRYDEAISAAERAYELAPNNGQVLFFYGTVLYTAGRYQEALLPLREALRIDPIPPNSRLRSLACALGWGLQRYDEAIACIRKAVQREPSDILSQVILTSLYSLASREEEARATAQEVLRINPKFSVDRYISAIAIKDTAARDRVACALKKSGLSSRPEIPLPDHPSIAVLPFTNLTDDPKQDFFSDGLAEGIIIALTKLPEVFVIARNSSFAYKGKAPDLRQVGHELGVKYVLEGERALALALNENLAEGHAFMGRIHLTRGQHDEAVKRGEQAAALAPNSDFALAALAFTLRYCGKPVEAIGLYRKAMRLNPLPPSWYAIGLGSCYFDLARYEDAIGAAKKPLKDSPDNLPAHLILAAAYSMAGRSAEAQVEAAEVLRIDPKFSLDRFTRTRMYKEPADAERFHAALRRAGIR
jgi:adenylate cyclase